MNKINIEPELGSVPEIKTQYWYVRSNYIGENFTVTEAEWVGGISDLYRLTKGNVYLSREEAEKVMMMLNDRLDRLKSITADAKQKNVSQKVSHVRKPKLLSVSVCVKKARGLLTRKSENSSMRAIRRKGPKKKVRIQT